MRNLVFTILAIASLHFVGAQTIQSGSRSTTGYIKSDGTIQNSSRSTVGYIKSDGTIQNSSRSTIGYIKSDGTIQNSSRSTVGYVKSDGTVQNSSRSTIGYIKDDGTVQNSSRSTIGYAKDVKKEWAAVAFFFFSFWFVLFSRRFSLTCTYFVNVRGAFIMRIFRSKHSSGYAPMYDQFKAVRN